MTEYADEFADMTDEEKQQNYELLMTSFRLADLNHNGFLSREEASQGKWGMDDTDHDEL